MCCASVSPLTHPLTVQANRTGRTASRLVHGSRMTLFHHCQCRVALYAVPSSPSNARLPPRPWLDLSSCALGLTCAAPRPRAAVAVPASPSQTCPMLVSSQSETPYERLHHCASSRNSRLQTQPI
jgi:hypothetical protein